MLARRDERVESRLPLARNELSLAPLREALRYFCAGRSGNAEWAIVPGARIRKLVPGSRSRKLSNLLEHSSDRRGGACHQSSKCVHDGELVPDHPSRILPNRLREDSLRPIFASLLLAIFRKDLRVLRERGVSPFRSVLPGVRVQPWRLQSRVRLSCIELSVSPFSARLYLTPCGTRMGRVQPWPPRLWQRNVYDPILPLLRIRRGPMSTSSSMTSPIAAYWPTRNTPDWTLASSGTRQNGAAWF